MRVWLFDCLQVVVLMLVLLTACHQMAECHSKCECADISMNYDMWPPYSSRNPHWSMFSCGLMPPKPDSFIDSAGLHAMPICKLTAVISTEDYLHYVWCILYKYEKPKCPSLQYTQLFTCIYVLWNHMAWKIPVYVRVYILWHWIFVFPSIIAVVDCNVSCTYL